MSKLLDVYIDSSFRQSGATETIPVTKSQTISFLISSYMITLMFRCAESLGYFSYEITSFNNLSRGLLLKPGCKYS